MKGRMKKRDRGEGNTHYVQYADDREETYAHDLSPGKYSLEEQEGNFFVAVENK